MVQIEPRRTRRKETRYMIQDARLLNQRGELCNVKDHYSNINGGTLVLSQLIFGLPASLLALQCKKPAT